MSEQAMRMALESCDAQHPSDGGRQWYDEKSVDAAITALRAELDVPQQPAALDAIYAAWHGAGVDIAGGNWKRFVGMLPPLYATPQAAPATALDAGGWRPIETAPKDGTSVIAFRPGTPPHIEAMEWVSYVKCDGVGAGAWHWSFDGDSPTANPPTHWIPIPSAPKD